MDGFGFYDGFEMFGIVECCIFGFIGVVLMFFGFYNNYKCVV